MRREGQLGKGGTHGHAEDRLFGLVNVTGTHFEDSAKETGCKKKERRWKECQEERDTRDNEREEKGRPKAGRGARKKKLLYTGRSDRQALRPNQALQGL